MKEDKWTRSENKFSIISCFWISLFVLSETANRYWFILLCRSMQGRERLPPATRQNRSSLLSAISSDSDWYGSSLLFGTHLCVCPSRPSHLCRLFRLRRGRLLDIKLRRWKPDAIEGDPWHLKNLPVSRLPQRSTTTLPASDSFWEGPKYGHAQVQRGVSLRRHRRADSSRQRLQVPKVSYHRMWVWIMRYFEPL